MIKKEWAYVNFLFSHNVVDKKTGQTFMVYSIRRDKNGYPHFLIYKENQWTWASAKYFKPSEITGNN